MKPTHLALLSGLLLALSCASPGGIEKEQAGAWTRTTRGMWLLHCHVGDHMMAGMYATHTIQ